MDHLRGSQDRALLSPERQVTLPKLDVGVCFGGTTYCDEAPFHPAVQYSEYPFPGKLSSAANPAYDCLRRLLLTLGLDAEHAGTPQWNPLRELIQPGQTVLLKPNFVVSRHAAGGDLFSAITHPSLLRALVDYAYLALRGEGRILIADSPQMDCDFDELLRRTRLESVQELYREEGGFAIEILDLRDFCLVDPDQDAYSTNRRRLPGDPLGEVVFDLGERSHFYGIENHDRFYGADYDRTVTVAHHHGRVHRYSVSRTVLSADVVISVPKLKVHKKVGVTLNVKGLVGINTNKNYLVHYRLGTPAQGGDQLPDDLQRADRLLVRVQRYLFDRLLARQSATTDAVYGMLRAGYRLLVKPFVKLSSETVMLDGGNWHGNDTAWRMAADLLKIFLYGAADGTLRSEPQRRIFCVVDGIVGGEKNGPLLPDAKPAGCLVGGEHPLAVDVVAARLMGFDPRKIRQFSLLEDSRGFNLGLGSIEEINVRAAEEEVRDLFRSRSRFLDFAPHPGWVGQVER